VVKRLLGHTSLTTTMGYLHISQQTLEKVVNPLDQMSWADALAF
jgi:site-specific recombinase XerD